MSAPFYIVGPRGPKGDPGDGGGLSHDEVTGIVNAALAALPPSGLTSGAVQALIATALQPIETTAQVNAAIAAAIAALPADGVTSVAQVNAAIASALASYENTAAVTAAIAAALSPYETASQVTAALNAAITRPHLEEVLYDELHSWELVPGSDVMATTVGVLPKFSWENGGAYMGLVTIAAGVTISDTGSWFLMPADSVLGETTFNDPGNLAIYDGAVPPGVYVAVNNANTPPYAFPEGWTPGNTTGSGPVVPFVGAGNSGADHYAGLVTVEDGFTFPNGQNYVMVGGDSQWFLVPPTATLTVDGLESALYDSKVSNPVSGQAYLAIYYTTEGDTVPTALPEGWTFRPYGIGQIALTDENVGGVIDDIAYVVSGYIANSITAARIYYGASTLRDGEYTLAVGDVFHLAGPASDGQGAVYRVLHAGAIEVTGGSAYNATSSFVAEEIALHYWPFIERLDLAQKKWLPRIPLPTREVTLEPEVPFSIDAVAHTATTGADYSLLVRAGWNYWVATFQVPVDFPQLPKIGSYDVYLVEGGSIESQYRDPAYWYASSTGIKHDDINRHGDGETFQALKFVVDSPFLPTPEELRTWWDALQTVVPAGLITGMLNYPSGAPVRQHVDAVLGMRPYAIEGGIGAVIDGKLYFGGGDSDNAPGTEFWVYDPVDGSIVPLADMDSYYYPDYTPYGVVGGVLWGLTGYNAEHGFPGDNFTHNVAVKYDTAHPEDGWVSVLIPGSNFPIGDQAQGFEIDGKLWFAYDGAVTIFDPVTLTVTAGAALAGTVGRGAPFLIGGKIHVFTNHLSNAGVDAHLVYDPMTDAWSHATDVAVPITTNYDSEFVGVTYEGLPYLLSAVYGLVQQGIRPAAGVWGLTGTGVALPASAGSVATLQAEADATRTLATTTAATATTALATAYALEPRVADLESGGGGGGGVPSIYDGVFASYHGLVGGRPAPDGFQLGVTELWTSPALFNKIILYPIILTAPRTIQGLAMKVRAGAAGAVFRPCLYEYLYGNARELLSVFGGVELDCSTDGFKEVAAWDHPGMATPLDPGIYLIGGQFVGGQPHVDAYDGVTPDRGITMPWDLTAPANAGMFIQTPGDYPPGFPNPGWSFGGGGCHIAPALLWT